MIDYEEAKNIFKVVRKHTINEEIVGKSLNIKYPAREQVIEKLFPQETIDDKTDSRRYVKGGCENQKESGTFNSPIAGEN